MIVAGIAIMSIGLLAFAMGSYFALDIVNTFGILSGGAIEQQYNIYLGTQIIGAILVLIGLIVTAASPRIKKEKESK